MFGIKSLSPQPEQTPRLVIETAFSAGDLLESLYRRLDHYGAGLWTRGSWFNLTTGGSCLMGLLFGGFMTGEQVRECDYEKTAERNPEIKKAMYALAVAICKYGSVPDRFVPNPSQYKPMLDTIIGWNDVDQRRFAEIKLIVADARTTEKEWRYRGFDPLMDIPLPPPGDAVDQEWVVMAMTPVSEKDVWATSSWGTEIPRIR